MYFVNINMIGQNKTAGNNRINGIKSTISGSVLSNHWDCARTAMAIKWHIPHCILGEVSLTASDKASN